LQKFGGRKLKAKVWGFVKTQTPAFPQI